jgi:acyl-CoA thioesterase
VNHVDPWADLELSPTDDPLRFTASISDIWRITAAPIGGVVSAIAVEAIARVLDRPDQRPRTVTSMFAAPVLGGPVEIEVTVIRQGRSISQLLATVRNVGASAGLTAVAAFGAARRGLDVAATMPVVPSLEQSRSWMDSMPPDFALDFEPSPFWTELIEGRLSIGRFNWEQPAGGAAIGANWYRFRHEHVRDGFQHRGVLSVLSDTMPGGFDNVIGDNNWFAPSVDLTVHFTADVTPGWLLSYVEITTASDGYATARAELWDPRTSTLAAVATQVMVFTFSD